jgi:hypothetical protein
MDNDALRQEEIEALKKEIEALMDRGADGSRR